MLRLRSASPCPRILIAITAAGLALSGCGVSGGNGGGGTTTGGSSALVAMSHCMRTHGVSNFPDPTTGPGGSTGLSVARTPGSPTVTVGGIAFSGPAFTAAEKACQFGAFGARPKLTEAMKQGMLKSARCMRTHGVPDFPDPSFGAAGGIKTPSSQIDHNSPAFRAAADACRNVGVGIPGGG